MLFVEKLKVHTSHFLLEQKIIRPHSSIDDYYFLQFVRSENGNINKVNSVVRLVVNLAGNFSQESELFVPPNESDELGLKMLDLLLGETGSIFARELFDTTDPESFALFIHKRKITDVMKMIYASTEFDKFKEDYEIDLKQVARL